MTAGRLWSGLEMAHSSWNWWIGPWCPELCSLSHAWISFWFDSQIRHSKCQGKSRWRSRRQSIGTRQCRMMEQFQALRPCARFAKASRLFQWCSFPVHQWMSNSSFFVWLRGAIRQSFGWVLHTCPFVSSIALVSVSQVERCPPRICNSSFLRLPPQTTI
jgi:hypothetical protein